MDLKQVVSGINVELLTLKGQRVLVRVFLYNPVCVCALTKISDFCTPAIVS